MFSPVQTLQIYLSLELELMCLVHMISNKNHMKYYDVSLLDLSNIKILGSESSHTLPYEVNQKFRSLTLLKILILLPDDM